MKNIICMLTLFLTLTTYAQKERGTILKNSGELITIYDGSNSDKKKSIGGMAAGSYGPIAFNEKLLYYFDFDGNIQDIKNTEYSEAKLGNGEVVFMPLPHSKDGSGLRVHRIIAKSDKYILGDYIGQGVHFFYIFDSEKNLVERRIAHSAAKSVSEKAIRKVKEYFGDCADLINELEVNLANPSKRGMMKTYSILYHIEEGEMVNYINNVECN
ncbi:hypothetical protein QRD02_04365 [Aequorivita sp. SDUM287046]|uniref:DUF4369 domain-containing protein n=1 Tax=Aequorivita aurantiaca TaxID=3053356 RepID=A0ABT8DKD8_9FLAO|nr:hypothetical protein [Aequorivita aurantiaca]MDN3723605.1 hypothetical protein [Aequorivita aurantiaca]